MDESKTRGATSLAVTGFVLMVLGVLAMASPAVAGQAVVVIIGAVLSLAGIAQFVQGMRGNEWRDKSSPLVRGALTTLAGAAVLAQPVLGMDVLAIFLAIFFAVAGTWKMITSFAYRPASGWIAMLLSGALGFLWGWLIWRQWPMSGPWAVGILVGADLLTTGAALAALAVTMRRLKKAIVT